MQLTAKQNEYSVYVHTNKTNGKKYYGITRQAPERRWQKGRGYSDTYFGRAIEKYGWDGFTHEVLFSGMAKEDACALETSLISKYKTNQREYGYNVADGGQTCNVLAGKKGVDHPNHQRVKMIDPTTKKVLRVFGSQSEAACMMGVSRKGITKACIGVGVVTYKGYVWEYADKKYIKPQNPGVGNYAHTKVQKRVKMVDVDGREHIYESVKSAGESLGIRSSTISRYLRGIRKDACGRRWYYAP